MPQGTKKTPQKVIFNHLSTSHFKVIQKPKQNPKIQNTMNEFEERIFLKKHSNFFPNQFPNQIFVFYNFSFFILWNEKEKEKKINPKTFSKKFEKNIFRCFFDWLKHKMMIIFLKRWFWCSKCPQSQIVVRKCAGIYFRSLGMRPGLDQRI